MARTPHSIYRSADARAACLALYDEFVGQLNTPVGERFVDTASGKTHVLTVGPETGEPLVVVHGGNALNPSVLSWFLPLAERYRIYAPDIVGQPGKSAETRLSTKDLSYGVWLGEVIDGLGLDKPALVGVSFGGSIAIRALAHRPDLAERLVLLVSGSIAMGSKLPMITQVVWPMLRYRLSGNEKWLRRALGPMSDDPTEADVASLGMAFTHLHMSHLFPMIGPSLLSEVKTPVLVLAAERDIWFGGQGVVARARVLFPSLVAAEVLPEATHLLGPDALRRARGRIEQFLTHGS